MTRKTPTRPTIAAASAAVLGVTLLVLVLPAASGTTTEGLSFEKGTDFAQAEDLGWVSDFTLGEGNASFELTLHGLPGGTITIDDLVTANRTSQEGFRVNVTDPLDGEADVTIRAWNGTTPPTSDEDANVCALVDTSTAGMVDGTCTAQHVHLQYVITTSKDAASIASFAFQLVGTTSEEPVGNGGTTAGGGGGGGGGGGFPALDEASDQARSTPTPEDASHSYVASTPNLAEGGELTITFPDGEKRLRWLILVVDRPCPGLRAHVDRYPERPAHAEPPDPTGSRTLGFTDLQVTCQGIPIGEDLQRALLGLNVAPEELAADEQERHLHALRTGSPVWVLAGSLRGGATEDLPALVQAQLPRPGLVALVVDHEPPAVTPSILDAAHRQGAPAITVEATDNVSLDHLSVFVDGHKLETRTEPPFQVTVTSTDVGEGPVTVQAIAQDVSGMTAHATTNATLIPDTTPPTIDAHLEEPDTDGQLVIRANVQDAVPIEQVEFRLNGERFATVQAPPFEAPLNVDELGAGPHTIQILAYDAAGNVGTAEQRFDVDPEETPLPHVIGLWLALVVAALLARNRQRRNLHQ